MSSEIFTDGEDPREGKPSASGIFRIALCPASWRAEKNSPTQQQTTEAATGTRLHLHMQQGTTPEGSGDEEDAVNWCRQAEGTLCAEFGMNGKNEREIRLWDTEHKFSGQLDSLTFSSESPAAMVLDYKFGPLPVAPPAENWQLLSQALIVLDNYTDIHTVYAGVLQPYVSRDIPELVEVTRETAPALRKRLYAILRAAEDPTADYVPGSNQCRYCRAADACPALRHKVNQISQVDLRDWPEWPAEKKLELYQMSRLAKKLADKIEKHVREDLASGVQIPGLALAKGRKMFKITNPSAAFYELSTRFGMSPEEFSACCSVQISKIDTAIYKRLKAEDPTTTAAKSDALVREALADCGEENLTQGSIKEMK